GSQLCWGTHCFLECNGSEREEAQRGIFRNQWRRLSVRQELSHERTVQTKVGMYLLASSLAAAALDSLFDHPERRVIRYHPQRCLSGAHKSFFTSHVSRRKTLCFRMIRSGTRTRCFMSCTSKHFMTATATGSATLP